MELALLSLSGHFPQSASVLHALSFFSLALHPFVHFFEKLAALFATQFSE